MTNSEQQLIEQIVGQVLKQLQNPSAEAVRPAEDVKPTAKPEPKPATPAAVVISEKVITEAVLESSAAGKKTIQISPQAILTPSARDYIRRNNLTLTQETKSGNSTSHSGKWKLFVLNSLPVIESVRDDLKKSAGLWTTEQLGLPQEAAQSVIRAICRGEIPGGVILSDKADLVCCLANRNQQVRAAVANDLSQVELLKKELGVNLLGIKPTGKSFFEVRRMLQAFSGSVPKLPATWQEIPEGRA